MLLLVYIIISVLCFTNKEIVEIVISAAKKTKLFGLNLDLCQTELIMKKFGEFIEQTSIVQLTHEQIIEKYDPPVGAKDILKDFKMFLKVAIHADKICDKTVINQLDDIVTELNKFIHFETQDLKRLRNKLLTKQTSESFIADIKKEELRLQIKLDEKLKLIISLNKKFKEIINTIVRPVNEYEINVCCKPTCNYLKTFYDGGIKNRYTLLTDLKRFIGSRNNFSISEYERGARQFKSSETNIMGNFLEEGKDLYPYLIEINCIAAESIKKELHSRQMFVEFFEEEFEKLKQIILNAKDEEELFNDYYEAEINEICSKWWEECSPLLNEGKTLSNKHFKNKVFLRANEEVKSTMQLGKIDKKTYSTILGAKDALEKVKENIGNVILRTSSAIDKAGNLPMFSKEMFRRKMRELCLEKEVANYESTFTGLNDPQLVAGLFENEERTIERFIEEYNKHTRESTVLGLSLKELSLITGGISIALCAIYYYFT